MKGVLTLSGLLFVGQGAKGFLSPAPCLKVSLPNALAPACALSIRQPTLALNLLAEPPMEEKKKQKSNDENGDWIPTDGGFLPNLGKFREEKKHMSISTKQDTLLEQIKTLDDYKRVVVDEADSLVVVFWFAPWCKSCKAIAPKVKQLAKEHQGVVKFIRVPVIPETKVLYEGLGVPSVPFGHIYEPTVGLVEERKMNRKDFATFKTVLQQYIDGECDFEGFEEEEQALDSFQ